MAEPPHNLDAEESVLGAMMMSGKAIDAALDEQVKPGDFYRHSNGRIFEAIVSLYSDDAPADAVTVIEKLNTLGTMKHVTDGAARVNEIAASTPAASNARHYAKIVRQNSTLRALIRAGAEIQKIGEERVGDVEELIGQAEKAVFDLALSGRSTDWVPLSSAVADAYMRLEAIYRRGDDVIGLPTGFRRLDDMTSGLQPGNLIVIAARPSMGKSGLALSIAANVAVGRGKTVGLFTLEMSKFEVTQRLLSSEGLIDSHHLRNGKLNQDEWVAITAASSRLSNAPLMIDDSAVTTMELRAKARRLKMRYSDLSLVVVDYLQLMSYGAGSFESRVQDVSQTSRALKVLAAELQVPVIALSQLNRGPEQRHDKRPILSDLRESGSIEQDADLVAFIYRDEYYNPEDTELQGIAEINLAKHRNGPTGTIKLAWVSRYTRFSDLADS